MIRPDYEITVPMRGETAFVHTRVELFYRRFIDDLGTEYKHTYDLFEAHLKATVWGALYIEGLANYKLYKFTTNEIKRDDLKSNYWKITKQARLKDKLELIFASDRIERPWLKDVLKSFMQMVEIRNRLVHFKDEPTPFHLPSVVERVGINAPGEKWDEHTPHPKIVEDLLKTPISERLDVIKNLGDALENISD